jgi:hypothetical protein
MKGVGRVSLPSGNVFLPIYQNGMKLKVGLETVWGYFTAVIEDRSE